MSISERFDFTKIKNNNMVLQKNKCFFETKKLTAIYGARVCESVFKISFGI